jgi:hypothetical protein
MKTPSYIKVKGPFLEDGKAMCNIKVKWWGWIIVCHNLVKKNDWPFKIKVFTYLVGVKKTINSLLGCD